MTRLDTFARVICHFREFGASGHCLIKLQFYNTGSDSKKTYFGPHRRGRGTRPKVVGAFRRRKFPDIETEEVPTEDRSRDSFFGRR